MSAHFFLASLVAIGREQVTLEHIYLLGAYRVSALAILAAVLGRDGVCAWR
jgi:hypothetical protein